MPLLDCGDVVLHYKQAGEGPDIVRLSGGGGRASHWDEFQLPYLRRSFRNTTYDARGVGETSSPPWDDRRLRTRRSRARRGA